MNIFAFIRAVVGLANILADIARNKQLMDAGASREIAKGLARLADRLGIGKDVVKQVEALSDAELNAELKGD